MKGWIMVLSKVLEADETLSEWVQKAATFVRSLPPK
jgi:hypothetical protein